MDYFSIMSFIHYNPGYFLPLSIKHSTLKRMKSWSDSLFGSKSKDANQNEKITESMFNEIFDMVPDLVCVLSTDGHFKRLNIAWGSVIGYTVNEFRLRSFIDFVHLDDVKVTLEILDKIVKGKKSDIILNRYLCNDNSYKWTEWRIKLSPDKTEVFAISRDISEKKKIELAVKECEERYKSAFTTSPDALTISKIDGTYVDANIGITELTEYSKEEIIGKNSLDLGIWANSEDRIKVVKSIQENGSVKNIETVFRSKNGSLKPVLISASLILINQEPHILAVNRDISSSKSIEKALRVSENRFRQIAENSEDMIWEIDVNGLFTYCSQSVSNILGYNASDVVCRMHFFDLFEPEKREELKKSAFMTFERKEKFQNFIHSNVHKDGHTVILMTNGSPIISKKGELIGYRGTNTDITERVLAEKALRESEEKYRLLAVNSTDIIWTLNLQGNFTYVSPSVEKLRGFTPQEVMLHGIDGTLTPESAVVAKQVMNETLEAIKAGETILSRTLVLEHTCKDKPPLWFELTANVLFNDNHELLGFLGISRDVTERRRVEQKLIRTMAAVESASDAIGISDAQNHIIFRNQALADLFEYETSAELQEAGGWKVCFKDPMVGQEIYKSMLDGRPWKDEIEMVSRTGRVFPAFVRANAIKDENGNIIGLLGIITDITERIKTKEKLQHSEELFRSLADYSPNIILIVIKNKIYYVNQVGENKLGFTKDQLYSSEFDIKKLIAPEHEDVFNLNFGLNTEGKEVEPYELLMNDSQGRLLYTMVNSKPVQIGETNAILGVIMDISEQRWAENILKQKANQFEQFNKIMVDRELQMVELKKEVNELMKSLGKEVKYSLFEEDHS
jgi:PAS domain S-box-containing protein